jgi:post-segregation antitoxin (ccd killing protein)
MLSSARVYRVLVSPNTSTALPAELAEMYAASWVMFARRAAAAASESPALACKL